MEKRVKILILSKYIGPEQGIASVRWTKISKYIHKQYQADITVVTEHRNFCNEEDFVLKVRKDKLLEKDLDSIQKLIEVPLNRKLKLYYFMRNLYRKSKSFDRPSTEIIQEEPVRLRAKIKKEFYILIFDINNLLWAKAVKRFITNKDFLNYDVVISSSGPIWPHIVANYIKSKKKKIMWIADFRDPYAGSIDTNRSFKRHVRQSMKYCDQADCILQVNDTIKTYTPKHVPKFKITNGYDPDEQNKPLPAPKFNILYTGTMYMFYNIEPLCRAINDLIAEGKICRGDIRVDFLGNGKRLVDSQIKSLHVEDYVVHHGIISREETIKQQQKAAILMQMGRNTIQDKCEWTGKMYEYMMSEKPILYLVYGEVPYSLPRKQISKIGGYCYEEADEASTYVGMKDFLYGLFKEWKDTSDIEVKRDTNYIYQFSYPYIAKKVMNLIEERDKKVGITVK